MLIGDVRKGLPISTGSYPGRLKFSFHPGYIIPSYCVNIFNITLASKTRSTNRSLSFIILNRNFVCISSNLVTYKACPT
jgi:hypothetical protein